MYDPLSLSVLRRIQWLAEADELIALNDEVRDTFTPEQKEQYEPFIMLFGAVREFGRMGEHYFVDPVFSALVDHAVTTMPKDVVFDETVLQSGCGWADVDGGFLPFTDRDERERISVIIWYKPVHVPDVSYTFLLLRRTPPDRYADEDDRVVSHSFYLRPGESLDALLTRNPEIDGRAQYVMCLLHLMGQRLAAMPRRSVRANVQSQAEAYKMNMNPRIVTLRRLLYEKTEAESSGREYQCQWHVRGHWRQQFYHSTGEHHPVFIDAYIKGPEDKPLKPLTHSIFVARR